MEFPGELRERIRELCFNEDIKALSKAAERLSENYRKESSGGKVSAASRLDVLAYCAVRMPATFAAVSRAIELSLACYGGEISSVLDVGAGTGAGALAAGLLTDSPKITLIEREQNMIEAGREFLELMGISAEWIRGDISDGISGKADLAVCSYCLNELPENRRKAALKELMGAAGKLLVIVEPGTPKSFEAVREMRGELLRGGFKIAAPCTHEGECALPKDDWCHFTARVARSELHRRLKHADAPFEDEKFCFLAAAREDAFVSGARILRHPVIEKQKITLRLCSESGITARTVTGKDPLFKTARKAKTGDIFPAE